MVDVKFICFGLAGDEIFRRPGTGWSGEKCDQDGMAGGFVSGRGKWTVVRDLN